MIPPPSVTSSRASRVGWVHENEFIMSSFYVWNLVFLLVCGFGIVSCNREQCVAKNGNKCKSENNESNKYSKESNERYSFYLNKITEAKANYHPCEATKCNCHSKVITHDLKPFKGGISKELIDSVREKGTRYQIINGKIYRDKNCMFPARCLGIEHFLFEILPKLPNMEFVINTRDWPQINKNYGLFGPVFSFSKTSEFYDIMYPAWAFWEGGPAISLFPRGIGRWDLLREQLGKEANKTYWEQKETKAFFRGSRTSSERDTLILLSREHPDLVDAQYTKNQAWKSDADTLHAPPAKEVSFNQHCNYKYLFNFRGVAASFRFKHVLLCKSLVFHVGDEWLEFFYPSLKPWVHYIPVDPKSTMKTLKELIEFVREHDELAKEIAENGFNMIWNHLRMKDVNCFWHKLLRKYAKLLTYKVERNDELIEIWH